MKIHGFLLSGLLMAVALVCMTSVEAQQGGVSTPGAATPIGIFDPLNPLGNGGPSPNVVIGSPLPVSQVSGQVTVTGVADLPGMSSYYLETRPLDADLSLSSSDVPWIPATLPISQSVTNGTLAQWNTQQLPDGIYQLRLTVDVSNQPSVSYVVAPIRIDNNSNGITPPTSTSAPTLAAASGGPATVTALVNANVRGGDSEVVFPVTGDLLQGQTAPVVGVSSDGSGWYYIELADGSYGWISPSVVTVSGDISNVPPLPPPQPQYVAAAPTVIPAPQSYYYDDVVVNGITISPNPPTCLQDFTVEINLTNAGSADSNSGVVTVQDIHENGGQVTTSGVAAYPPLSPGTSYLAALTLNVDTYYNETHDIQAITSSGSQNSISYTLVQGDCGVNPTPTPTPISGYSNIVVSGIDLNPSPPVCGQSFTVDINVTNNGNTVANAGSVDVDDMDMGRGRGTTHGSASYPALNPGQTYTASVALTVSSNYNETHVVHAVANDHSQTSTSYTLAQGQCAANPTTPPTRVPSGTPHPRPSGTPYGRSRRTPTSTPTITPTSTPTSTP